MLEHQEREETERRENPGKKSKKPPSSIPDDPQQMNLVDPDSAVMRKSRRDGWQQAYNAQIVVDAAGSQMILGEYVIQTPSDGNELEPALASIWEYPTEFWGTPGMQTPMRLNGYRRPARKSMWQSVPRPASEEGNKIYAKRRSTVEPVFGSIKAAMGFRQFLLRGPEKVSLEWTLVCTAYSLKRLCALKPG